MEVCDARKIREVALDEIKKAAGTAKTSRYGDYKISQTTYSSVSYNPTALEEFVELGMMDELLLEQARRERTTTRFSISEYKDREDGN